MLLQRITLITLLLLALARVAAAQRSTASVAVTAGRATDVAGLTSSAATIVPSISLYPTGNSVVGLAGSATRFAGNAWSAAGGGTLNARHPLGRPAVTLGAASTYTATSYDLSYITADFTPALEVGVDKFTMFGGVHASHATTWFTRDRFPSPPFGGLPGGVTQDRASVGRHGIAALYGALFRAVLGRASSIFAGAREERGTVADATQVDRTITAGLTHGMFSFAGNAGDRNVEGARSRIGNASLSIALSSAVTMEVGAGQYAANRLTGATAGRFMTAGLSVHLRRGERSPPRPSGVSPVAPGMTRLSILARDANTVEVAGDFTKWQLTVTRRSANGVWFVDLSIPPGQYRYTFRIDGKEWRIPEGVAAAADDFGGTSAWLTVSRPGTGRVVP